NRRRGEFVLVLEGAAETSGQDRDVDQLLLTLASELPAAKAAKLAAAICQQPRAELYDRLRQLKGVQ
ncbi:MAG: hypothetical protein R3352_03360, partial [Salinisphaeraceae bacterium]|nr:hypothetical protein [Salinisphaeraceae bacterium]